MTTTNHPWRTTPLFGFDLETTGVDPLHDRIVTAAIVTPEWEWSVLTDPGIPIPDGAAKVHGITTDMARADGIPYPEALTAISQRIGLLTGTGFGLVAYNAAFDLSMLQSEERRVFGEVRTRTPGLVLDPWVIDKALDRYRKGARSLGATADVYGVELGDAHNAVADARAAVQIAEVLRSPAMSERIAARPDRRALQLASGWDAVADVMEWQRVQHRQSSEQFAAYLQGVGEVDRASKVSTDWPVITAPKQAAA